MEEEDERCRVKGVCVYDKRRRTKQNQLSKPLAPHIHTCMNKPPQVLFSPFLGGTTKRRQKMGGGGGRQEVGQLTFLPCALCHSLYPVSHIAYRVSPSSSCRGTTPARRASCPQWLWQHACAPMPLSPAQSIPPPLLLTQPKLLEATFSPCRLSFLSFSRTGVGQNHIPQGTANSRRDQICT